MDAQFNDSAILQIIVTDQNEYLPTVTNAQLHFATSELSLPGKQLLLFLCLFLRYVCSFLMFVLLVLFLISCAN